MIIPPGARLKLDPRDEYMHVPEPVANYNESMYFNAFDTAQGLGAWLRLGNRPNEGHAEMSCCVYLPDGRVGFMHQRPRIEGNAALDAGGLRFEVVEPFHRLSVAYQGELLLLDDPRAMANPRDAFRRYPRRDASIALDYSAASPMHGGELVRLDGRTLDLDPDQAVFRGHTEQQMTVRGRIEVDGQSFAVDGVGFRDKSWGPRHWHSFYWYKWLPASFGPDFGVLLALMGRRGDSPAVTGHVFEGDELHPLRDTSIETQWDDKHYPVALTVNLRTRARSYVLKGRVRTILPLRHKLAVPAEGADYTRILEALVDYECEGHRTLGIAEYCDLIVDGRPISLAVET